ncbi:conserved hypothetical protein [[Clostridium] ultunense Esp]|uniref:Uncharacterized protein n=1 Tax=[Clostridium] ultunense Esp TaxID=1288971 RepID=M1YTX4_9FIRM|nr:hypothetical protein [Schnuerera ultunensis]CCQ94020.1 conserved hypothetical protein [[Clostridium] ultunense Esp]SHD76877.1 conserved protein of unknown function [[Clostridium] ultunense Esp]
MVLAKADLWQIYNGLRYNFLYNGDINSIHILLNLYDLETKVTNISPKYICTKEIRKRIKRLLFPRKDRQLISNNIAMLIHEDIDRLELTLYLEGYKNGYYSKRWVNILEDNTIKYLPIEELYGKNYLFHYNIPLEEIKKLKVDFWEDIDKRNKETKYLDDFINGYCEKIIKRKIYNLNMYIDKQLKIEYNLNKPNIKEEAFLSTKELHNIYKTIVKTIMKNTINTYKESSWFGVNDRVLNRYL